MQHFHSLIHYKERIIFGKRRWQRRPHDVLEDLELFSHVQIWVSWTPTPNNMSFILIDCAIESHMANGLNINNIC